MKILIMDADRDLLKSLAQALQSAGAKSGKLVTSGSGALKEISKIDPSFDCILMGEPVGTLDALVTCRLIRRLRGYEHTPIFFIGQSKDKDAIDAAFAAGANDMVSREDLKGYPDATLQAALDLQVAVSGKPPAQGAPDSAAEADGEKPAFGAKVPVGAVENFVDRLTFDNYIQQLSNADQFDTRIFAVRIEGMAQIHEQRPYEEFLKVLRRAAEAMALSFPVSRRLFSYSGGGVFICAYNGQSSVDREDLARKIREGVIESLTNLGLAAPERLKIRVGNSRKAMGVLRSEVERNDAEQTSHTESKGLTTAEFLARRKRVMSTMLMRH